MFLIKLDDIIKIEISFALIPVSEKYFVTDDMIKAINVDIIMVGKTFECLVDLRTQ